MCGVGGGGERGYHVPVVCSTKRSMYAGRGWRLEAYIVGVWMCLCVQRVLHCQNARVLIHVEWVGATAQLQAIQQVIVRRLQMCVDICSIGMGYQ